MSYNEVKAKYRENARAASLVLKPLVDITNFENPIQQNYEFIFENYEVGAIKENRLYFSNSTFESNKLNWFYKGKKTVEFKYFVTITSDQIEANNKSSNGIRFFIHFLQTLRHYERSYIQIPYICPVVGGLMSLVFEVVRLFY